MPPSVQHTVSYQVITVLQIKIVSVGPALPPQMNRPISPKSGHKGALSALDVTESPIQLVIRNGRLDNVNVT